MFHERSRERTGCRSYSWTHPCVLASIPPAEGLSTALLNAVLLYRLVTWHQELPHDSSALHISRNCTIRNTHESSRKTTRSSTSNNWPLRQICLQWCTTTSQWRERDTRRPGLKFWPRYRQKHRVSKLPRHFILRKLPHSSWLQSLVCDIGFRTIYLRRVLCGLNKAM